MHFTWYSSLLIFEVAVAIIVFCSLFFFTVPYGRYAEGLTQPRFMLTPRLGWLIMEVPAMLTIALTLLYLQNGFLSAREIFFLTLWEVHYIYRGLVYPFLLPSRKPAVPIYVAISGAVFNILNGILNAWGLLQSRLDTPGLSNFFTWQVILGIIVFFTGFVTHLYSDRLMRILKRSNNGKYVVPQKFPHTIITAPNYFGEILQWTGWTIATQSWAGLVFVIFTIANLVPRAFAHRNWYRQNFPDYPKKRRAILPFLF